MPDAALCDHAPQIADKILRVEARIDEAVILPEQFLARVLRNSAEFLVDKRDPAPCIGDRYDGVLVDAVRSCPIPEGLAELFLDRFLIADVQIDTDPVGDLSAFVTHGTPRARIGCQFPSTPRKRCSTSQAAPGADHSFQATIVRSESSG